jgi:histone deacetylase 1/2
MLHQHKYILDILTRASMPSCKPVDTLVSPSKVTILPDTSFSNPTRFHQIMGALQYLTFTHPDIRFTVNRVFQFMHARTDSHWTVIKRILRYLKGTASYSFHITRGSSFALHGFTGADWLVVSIDDRKFTSGYLVFFGQTLISWKSSKQRTVARSTTEVVYKTLADGTAEVIWLQYLLTDL